mgnify:CR=1 FL=1
MVIYDDDEDIPQPFLADHIQHGLDLPQWGLFPVRHWFAWVLQVQ